jgi:pimeloyl-ACP methyl ester carboxylesterase
LSLVGTRIELSQMPLFSYDKASIYFQEYGSGYPLLLLAPGGIRSKITTWRFVPFDPRKEFAANFRIIAMDQRHCGQSRARLTLATAGSRTLPTKSPCSITWASAAAM